MNKVGRINYVNTLPFFEGWPSQDFPLIEGSPAELAKMAKRNELLAGPLPIVETWNMSADYEPLGQFGIGVWDQSRSVFLLSRVEPGPKLFGPMGLTPQSATSVALLEFLATKAWDAPVTMRKGFHDSDQGRLVIGDDALRIWMEKEKTDFPFVTDLAQAWHDFTGKGFVFARWVVQKNASPAVKKELEEALTETLEKNMKRLDEIAARAENQFSFPKDKIAEYLKGFQYRLTENQRSGETQFKKEWLERISPVMA